jgi:hypothetical protein
MLPEGAGYEPTEWAEMHSWSKSVEGGDAAILALLDDPVALVDAIREMTTKKPNTHQHCWSNNRNTNALPIRHVVTM